MRRAISHSLEARRLLAFTPYDGDLSEQVEFQGLASPVAVEFASTGRVFVSEKAGIIKTYDSMSDKTNSIALDIQDQVNSASDRGLLGLAVSPNFTSDGYVYLSYTFDGDLTDSVARATNTDSFSTLVSGKLVRYHWNGSTLDSPTLLIHDWPQQYSSHSIGHLAFGADGYLYASGGEGANFNAVDYGQLAANNFGDPTNEGGALRSQDILSSGDPLGLDGTLIRIDPATGAGAPGNPLAGSGDANARRVLAVGLRNPYRFNFRPGTSEVWIGDVGWTSYEEINRYVPTSSPRNFGWPAKEGAGDQPGYKSANLPLLAGIYNGSVPTVAPYYTYNHSNKIEAGSAEPTGGSSITGVAFYDAQIYPYEYYDSMFFADYARKTLYVARPDGNGLPNMATARLLQTNVPIVELQAGPNGDIFYVDITAGKVTRITAKGPKARLTVDHTSGSAPLTVHLDASASSDPDELDQISFAWDLDNDGAYDDASGATVTKIYTTKGTYTARVKVSDLTDLSDIESVTINVDSSAPVPAFNGPSPNKLWAVGTKITFGGRATDAEDGTLSASKLKFQFVLMHANAANPNTPAHEHIVATFDGVSSGDFIAPDHEYPSWLEVRLTATDSDGNATTISRRLNPATVDVQVGASRPGVKVAFNGDLLTTPFTVRVINGSVNTVSVPPKQEAGGTPWGFDAWSDGVKTTAREFIATRTNTTLSANGRIQAWRRVEGRPMASTGSFAGNASDAPPRAFDSNLTTGFKSAGTGGWIGANLGSAQFVGRIGVGPLSGVSLAGGRIQASNKVDFKAATTVYTFGSSPAAGAITEITEGDGLVVGQFRYFRYIAPSGNYAGMAEMQFSVSEPYINGRGTTFGSAPIAGTAIQNAFDGKLNTYYTADKANKGFVALDLGTPTKIDLVRFAARVGYKNAMVGGKIQLANDSRFGDAVTVLTINSLADGWNDVTVSTSANYRYARYIGTDGSYSTIAEFAVLTAPQTPVPAAAGKVSVLTSDAQQGVNMVWGDNSILETGFRIRRSVDGGAYKTLENLPANTTAYKDTGVVGGKRYVYRIIPMNSTGYGTDTTVSTLVAPTGTAPGKPTNLVATMSGSSVALAWRDNSTNEVSYRIDRRYTGDVWTSIASIEANRTSYVDSAVFSDVGYEYRVVAVNGLGATMSDGASIIT